MGQHGNSYDNGEAESLFQLLKRERIRRKLYLDREEAQCDVFNYIELPYNPKRHHSYSKELPLVEFEKQYFNRQLSVY